MSSRQNLLQFQIQSITSWAKSRQDIRSVLMVGSQARHDHPADSYSDLDLILFTNDFTPYQKDDLWLESLGKPLACIRYPRNDENLEFLMLFETGDQVDFNFLKVEKLQQMVEDQKLDRVFERGFQILLDKDGLAEKLPTAVEVPLNLIRPEKDAFNNLVQEFWYYALSVAQDIRRKDLWIAKTEDVILKDCLLKMMEWHAFVVKGEGVDTWYGGRFLNEWIDSQTREALQGIFGRYDSADSWRALLATIGLFRRLALETSSLLNYGYPLSLDQFVTARIIRLSTGPLGI